MNHIIITLDLSTASTGYAVFDKKTKKLITYGALKPQVPGLHKLKYPAAALFKIKDISAKVKDLIAEHNPDKIIIEEVNRGVNRISQKSLDALHFFVLDYLCILDKDWLNRIVYIDSNGSKGWRGALGLRLSDEDKKKNKEIRAKNKKSKMKYNPIDWKTLAQRHVNAKFNLNLDIEADSSNADICDAIALGDAYLEKFIK